MSDTRDLTAQQYGARLFRAAGLVVVGAGLHVLLPDRSVLLIPEIAPQQFVYFDERPPQHRLLVERRTIFAPVVADGDDNAPRAQPRVVPASALGLVGPDLSAGLTDLLAPEADRPTPVGTAGDEATGDSRDADPAAALSHAERPLLSQPERPPQPEEDVATATVSDSVPVGAAAAAPNAVIPAVRREADSAISHAGERLEPSSGPARATSESEEELVRRLLDEYAVAYERLDVRAATAIWPSVDGKALKRAFERLSAQRLTLQSCGITISGSTANARCRGSATYHPKIGSRSVQVASGEWLFDLSKKGAAWRIVNTFVR